MASVAGQTTSLERLHNAWEGYKSWVSANRDVKSSSFEDMKRTLEAQIQEFSRIELAPLDKKLSDETVPRLLQGPSPPAVAVVAASPPSPPPNPGKGRDGFRVPYSRLSLPLNPSPPHHNPSHPPSQPLNPYPYSPRASKSHSQPLYRHHPTPQEVPGPSTNPNPNLEEEKATRSLEHLDLSGGGGDTYTSGRARGKGGGVSTGTKLIQGIFVQYYKTLDIHSQAFPDATRENFSTERSLFVLIKLLNPDFS
ncbi:hypothetical protein AAMO2058_000532700 [Amorphochlora amoebiformis]